MQQGWSISESTTWFRGQTMSISRKLRAFLAVVIVAAWGNSAQAVELLVNGNLESSVSPPGWMLEQTVTDLPGASVNASEQISFANEPEPLPGELGILLRSFAGNTGAYTGLNHKINYILSQTVTVQPSAVGRTFTFSGSSFFDGDGDPFTNDGYSGGVEILDELSASGPVESPTETTFELAFLDSTGAVIGTPSVLDLRTEQMNDAVWRPHSVMGTAPTGTARVRVTAAARDMVDNTGFQNAYLDNFSLMRSDLPGTDFLTNGKLNMVGPPGGYTLTESPEGADTASFRDFANHTENGQQGLWLRAFANGDAIMSQTVPGVSGGEYDFSAWSKWEIHYSGGEEDTTTETFLTMEFLDAANSVIGTPLSLILEDAGQIPDNEWREFSLQGTAPANTANVRVSVGATGMFNTDSNPQSAFFDDLSLDLAVVGVPGDYNGNGTVDAADYVLWRDGGPLQNEVATPGQITSDDYDAWRARFGNTAGAASGNLLAAAAPEPGCCALAILAMFAGLGLGRSLRSTK
jgi:hypothetical protein